MGYMLHLFWICSWISNFQFCFIQGSRACMVGCLMACIIMEWLHLLLLWCPARQHFFLSFFFFKGEGIPVRKEWDTPLKINGWNIIMEVWKIIFLSKWVICRFHVNLPGCSLENSSKVSHFLQKITRHMAWFGFSEQKTNRSGDGLPISILTPQSSGEFENPKTTLLYIQVEKPLHLEGFLGTLRVRHIQSEKFTLCWLVSWLFSVLDRCYFTHINGGEMGIMNL